MKIRNRFIKLVRNSEDEENPDNLEDRLEDLIRSNKKQMEELKHLENEISQESREIEKIMDRIESDEERSEEDLSQDIRDSLEEMETDDVKVKLTGETITKGFTKTQRN